MFLLKLLALLSQESSQPADLGLFRNVDPHGGRIKQYGCTQHGCTVLEAVDHHGLENAKVYIVMPPPGLRLSHRAVQWCEGLLPCLLSRSIPKMLLLSYRGATKHVRVPLVTALTASGNVHQASKQGQLSLLVILLLISFLAVNPKSHWNPWQHSCQPTSELEIVLQVLKHLLWFESIASFHLSHKNCTFMPASATTGV